MQRLRRIRGVIARMARRVADPFPLTPLGMLVAAGAAAALKWLAYPELDLVMLVIGYAALGLVALAVLAVVPAALVVKGRARGATREGTLRTETRWPTATGFRVPSLRFLPLVQVRWEWESPAGARVEPRRVRGVLEEEATIADRGEIRRVRRRLVVQDAFGLARVALRKDDPAPIEVLPHVGGLGQLPILASLAGGDETPHPMGLEDGDRVELRRYVAGDPARFIHWKVYARTRKLMVRVPERALSRARRTIAYLIAGEDDGATAACARVAVEGDAFGEQWTFCADGAGEDATQPDHALRLIVRSSAARDRGARGLEPFLARAERGGPATAVIFAPPRPGPWLEPALQAIRKRRHRTRVVIGTDGVVSAAAPSIWRRALIIGDARRGTPAEELEQILRMLATVRCEVVVLDRRTGRRLGDLHRAAMRAIERPGAGARSEKAA